MKVRPPYLTVVPDSAIDFKPPRRAKRRRRPGEPGPSFTALILMLSDAADAKQLAGLAVSAFASRNAPVAQDLAEKAALKVDNIVAILGRLVREHPDPET